MNQPLVSILIPAYNAERWIAETITSAIAQTWKPTEIIVVDDGSIDRTLAIAQSFIPQGIQVIAQANRGASAARNRALAAAQGDFIQYLDADDLLAPNKIETQLNLLLDGNLDCIAAGEWARFYQHPDEAVFKPEPLWEDLHPIEWLIRAWEGQWMMHPAAWLVPRAIAQQAGSWNESLSLNDDGEYFSRVVLASCTVKFCWGARSYYRSGIAHSLSGSTSDVAWRSLWRTLELDRDRLLAVEDSDRTRRACATRFQRFIYEVYPAVPDLVEQAEEWVAQLGGSTLPPSGSPSYRLLSNLVGWKQAKQVQQWVNERRDRRDVGVL
ncbi:MAG TPA: glycosyltransferase family A protein [Crinalium sp.]|jgi:GT2 family glycosyltransferase